MPSVSKMSVSALVLKSALFAGRFPPVHGTRTNW
jgi:hypothetical protein